MNNSKLNKYSFVMAVVCNAFLAFVLLWNYAPEVFAQGQEPEVINFRLYGNHSEDSVSDTLAAVNWNLTTFQYLNNNTILVEAVKQ